LILQLYRQQKSKTHIVTVPLSSFIKAAFGYGGSQDLLSITGAVSAAITEEAATHNMADKERTRRFHHGISFHF
jgi:hypothetical protein